MNVVPPEMTVGFDVRIAVDVDHDQFHNMIDSWCKEAGEGVQCVYERKFPKIPPTSLNDGNPWWIAIKNTADEMYFQVYTDCINVNKYAL